MFDKCLTCDRIGESCVPNLMLLSFADLLHWCEKRQKQRQWTTQQLADASGVPVGTIKRIKAGDYDDCKYSTMRNLLIALIGGTRDEFSCTALVQRELQQMAELERQAAKLISVEKENADLRERISEYRETIDFLRSELKSRRGAETAKRRVTP